MPNNLVFFDKYGLNLNLVQNDDGIFEGSIYLNECSTNIFENEHIFILEKMVFNTSYIYAKPQSSSLLSIPSISIRLYTNINFRIYTYGLDNNIQFIDSASSNYDSNNAYMQLITNSEGTFKEVSSYKEEPMSFNIAFSSEEEGWYEDYLSIFLDDILIARIRLYCECVDEDERLGKLLHNFGMDIPQNDYIIFRETDINESNPDWRIINRKRKEMLLEYHNLKRNIGNYKGVLKAIDFYGYNNITLREVFQNMDETDPNYLKYKLVEVDTINMNLNLLSTLNNRKFRKTNLLALAFRLNVISDKEDDFDDLPITEEPFNYTIDEILIKLNALKEKLKKVYLPLKSYIYDITGEGDYFSKIYFRFVETFMQTSTIDIGFTLDFEIDNGNNEYISDVRPYIINCITNAVRSEVLDDNLSMVLSDFDVDGYDFGTLPSLIQSGLIDTVNKYNEIFLKYFFDTSLPFDFASLNDDVNIPVGNPIILRNNTFLLNWNQSLFNWDFLESIGNPSFNNYGVFDSYELEWRITLIENNQNKAYSFSKRSAIDSFNEILVILPYIGKYRIELRIYDAFGYPSIKYMEYEVFSKNVEFNGISKKWHLTKDWNDYGNTDWNSNIGNWNTPFSNDIYSDWNSNVTWETLNNANFSRLPYANRDVYRWESFNSNSRIDDLKHLTFDYMEVFQNFNKLTWNDLLEIRFDDYNETWNGSRISSDIPPHFILYDVQPNSTIRIGTKKQFVQKMNIVRRLDNLGNPVIHPEGNLLSIGSILVIARDANGYILNVNGIPAIRLPYVEVFELDMNGISTGNIIQVPSPYGMITNERDLLLEIGKYSIYVTEEMDSIDRFDVIGYTHTFTGDLQTAKAELDLVDDAIFRRFQFNEVKDEFDVVQRIQIVSKYDNEYGNAYAQYSGDILGTGIATATNLNPDWYDMLYMDNKMELENYVLVTFNYDNCRIPSKNIVEWRLVNYDNGNEYISNLRWFNHFFVEKGEYNLYLKLTDSNGNEFEKERKGFIKIV